MKKLFLNVTFATLCAALLAACGGDSGSSADSLGESSSSSEMDGAESSDSEDLNSNGSEGSEGESSGSGGGESSGSGEGNSSSSSAEPESSGSEGVEGSSASVPGGSSDASTYDVVTGTLADSRDGQTYRTVKIGDQVWMAENLNFVTDNSWCYNDDPANCAKYGRLYTWAAAMDSVGEWSTNGKGCGYGKECSATSPVRGVCPKGWHLPSRDEWEALFTAVGGSSTAGSKLKSATGWSSGGNGTDTFGFSSLPAGNRDSGGYYYYEGDYAYFWSSSEYLSNYAYYMDLVYSSVNASYLYNYFKNFGFSVRCLMD